MKALGLKLPDILVDEERELSKLSAGVLWVVTTRKIITNLISNYTNKNILVTNL
ncbi:hypothetical protein [Sebaldella sp. S0638]|uniref:hypothetical protein n=1 Tax=Sebaldella sp. S0638 TaxID=2957809 RepID=UPI00209F09B1|nr:hypothetical protein [Sebaldella sp. S0638]MCP1223460.1 hypothetical protein [Sebaldella sp. S0638]